MKSKFIQDTYIQYYPLDYFTNKYFRTFKMELCKKKSDTKVISETDIPNILGVGSFFTLKDGDKLEIVEVCLTEDLEVEYKLEDLIIYDTESLLLAQKADEERCYLLSRGVDMSENFPQIPTEVALKKARDDYKKEFGIKEKIKRWLNK